MSEGGSVEHMGAFVRPRQPCFGGAYELGGKMSQEDYLVCVGDMNQYIPPSGNPDNLVKRSFCAIFDGILLLVWFCLI